jgi:hypothetical protein
VAVHEEARSDDQKTRVPQLSFSMIGGTVSLQQGDGFRHGQSGRPTVPQGHSYRDNQAPQWIKHRHGVDSEAIIKSHS